MKRNMEYDKEGPCFPIAHALRSKNIGPSKKLFEFKQK